MPRRHKRRRGGVRIPFMDAGFNDDDEKGDSRGARLRNNKFGKPRERKRKEDEGKIFNKKEKNKRKPKRNYPEDHNGGTGFFDTKIRALETKKDDIEQCHAAKHKLVPKHPFRFLLSGASGSGKSTVLLNLLKRFYVKDDGETSYFDDIYAIGPTVKFDDLWKELDLEDDHLIEEPTVEKLEEIYKSQEAKIKASGIDEAPKVLIAFEDIISHEKFMNSKEFLKAYVMGRHFGISTMVCTQSFNKVPRPCRLQCQQIAFFPSSKSEMMIMCEEFCPPMMGRREFFDLMGYATTPDDEEEYPFLYVDNPAKPADRFRKTLGEAIRI